MELAELLNNADAFLVTVVLGYFWYKTDERLKQKEKEINELNTYIRTSDKENIQTLGEFGKFLESLIFNVDSIKGDLAKEIAHSAEVVKEKIDNLKEVIQSNGKL